MLCAFADRMLVKVTSMDDPEDLPGVERAVRVAAVIERIYSRCDRAEVEGPNLKKREAEHAQHTAEAIRARVALAGTLEWGDKRRRDLGKWWDAAGPAAEVQAQTASVTPMAAMPQVSPQAMAFENVPSTAAGAKETAGSASGVSPARADKPAGWAVRSDPKSPTNEAGAPVRSPSAEWPPP